MHTHMFMKWNIWWVAYLYLSVVTDGLNGCRGSQGALCVAGAELHHRLRSADQACHRAAVLNQLLLLLLQGRENHSNCQSSVFRPSSLEIVNVRFFFFFLNENQSSNC